MGLQFSPEDFAQLGEGQSLEEALEYSLCLGSDWLPTSFEFLSKPLFLQLLMGILTTLSSSGSCKGEEPTAGEHDRVNSTDTLAFTQAMLLVALIQLSIHHV